MPNIDDIDFSRIRVAATGAECWRITHAESVAAIATRIELLSRGLRVKFTEILGRSCVCMAQKAGSESLGKA